MYISLIVSGILILISALLNAEMDKMMMKYINLPKHEQAKVNPKWYSFNPLAKWKDGMWGTERAYNILFLKLGIKTTWLSDNCNDGWHTCKSAMIVLMCFAITICNTTLQDFVSLNFWIQRIVMLSIFGIIWNVTFNKSIKI